MRTDRFHKQVRRTQNNQGLQWAREQEDLQQGSSRTQRSSRKAAHHQYPLLQCIYLQEEEKKNMIVAELYISWTEEGSKRKHSVAKKIWLPGFKFEGELAGISREIFDDGLRGGNAREKQ